MKQDDKALKLAATNKLKRRKCDGIYMLPEMFNLPEGKEVA